MTWQPPAKAHDRRCSSCGGIFNTGALGALWKTAKGAPRYVHPGCQEPRRGWHQARPVPSKA